VRTVKAAAASPDGIFRQDFFDRSRKIKFRFFLVASASGF
jgi:hypothetical protein